MGSQGSFFFFQFCWLRDTAEGWSIGPGPRSAPCSKPCGHTKNGVMKERSENWISLLLLLLIHSVPAQVPARDASTGRTVIGLPLTGGEDRKPYTGRLGKIVLTRRLKCTFVFTLRASVGLISCGLDLLRNLTDDSHALDFLMWTLDLDLTNFIPCVFTPFSSFTHCLSFFQHSPSFPSFLYTHPSPLLPSLSLRAKDMKNRLGFLRRRNESPGSNPAGKIDKSMKSVK